MLDKNSILGGGFSFPSKLNFVFEIRVQLTVLTGAAVDNGVDGNLDGVLVGHDVDLKSNKSQY